MARVTSIPVRQFASDNHSGICPEAMAALRKANHGHVHAYGDDPWTRKATRLIRDLFETDCDVFFVFNGTAANALAIASTCQPFQSVICHEYAHLHVDECSAPGFFAHGVTLAPLHGKNAKLRPSDIEKACLARTDVHAPQPGAVTITQATELGTVYSPAEMKAIGKIARKHHLMFHVDGARFANAVASQRVAPSHLSWKAGVDVLSLGGTKNGMAMGEALVFFNRRLAADFGRRRKQGGQLASKMRFSAAQWIGLVQDGAWLRHATHANRIAHFLETQLRTIRSLKIAFPRQANSVFVEMPPALVRRLHQRGWQFYTDVGPGAARLMCSWDSTEQDVTALVRDIKALAR